MTAAASRSRRTTTRLLLQTFSEFPCTAERRRPARITERQWARTPRARTRSDHCPAACTLSSTRRGSRAALGSDECCGWGDASWAREWIGGVWKELATERKKSRRAMSAPRTGQTVRPIAHTHGWASSDPTTRTAPENLSALAAGRASRRGCWRD